MIKIILYDKNNFINGGRTWWWDFDHLPSAFVLNCHDISDQRCHECSQCTWMRFGESQICNLELSGPRVSGRTRCTTSIRGSRGVPQTNVWKSTMNLECPIHFPIQKLNLVLRWGASKAPPIITGTGTASDNASWTKPTSDSPAQSSWQSTRY